MASALFVLAARSEQVRITQPAADRLGDAIADDPFRDPVAAWRHHESGRRERL